MKNWRKVHRVSAVALSVTVVMLTVVSSVLAATYKLTVQCGTTVTLQVEIECQSGTHARFFWDCGTREIGAECVPNRD